MITTNFRWRVIACLLLTISCSIGISSVRQQLSSIQKESGLCLVGFLSDEMYVISFQNREARTIAIHGSDVKQPIISSDGRQVAYFSSIRMNADGVSIESLNIIDTSGRPIASFREFADPGQPAWSRDGSELAFSATEVSVKYIPKLVIVDVRSGSASTSSLTVEQVCWSPDGQMIAYTSGRRIWLYDLQKKGSPMELIEGDSPSWSPDGKWIAYCRGGKYYIISPGGGQKRQLFELPKANGPAQWSPDSKFVAVTKLAEGAERSLSLNTVGEDQYVVTVFRVDDLASDWVYRYGGFIPLNFTWVKNKELAP